MRSLILLLLAALASSGCSEVMPSAANYPEPIPSAAQPAVSSKGNLLYASRGLEAIRNALRTMAPEEALAQIPNVGLSLPTAQVEAGCVAAPGPRPVLLCHFGPSASQPVAQSILWHDGALWQSQLYPNAPPRTSAERKEALEPFGCEVGCHSRFVRARQNPTWPELLVVINMGAAQGIGAEEAQLLQLEDDLWEMVWVPNAGDWVYGESTVTFFGRGTAQFHVQNSSWRKEDMFSGYVELNEPSRHRPFQERWARAGSGYVMRDRAETPTPYGSLVRVIHYLSMGADEKARPFLTESIAIADARTALRQKPARQRWKATAQGDEAFLLEPTKSEAASLFVRFEPSGSQWLLAEIREIGG